jgi:high-affinity nickel-transport protein
MDSRRKLTAPERRSVAGMGAVVLGLHAVGFLLLLLIAGHGRGGLTVGIGLTAYTLGLRHAFDADHIAAIDNTTRRLMNTSARGDRRPLSVGFWFSLGHSTIVFGLSFLFAIGVRALGGQVEHQGSALHRVTNVIGTGVSGGFLYAIAALNAVILLGIVRVLREMRDGGFNEQELEARLDSRGLMSRLLGRFDRSVTKEWHMYPVGLLFGLGFDTASEVALLVLAAGAAGAGLPFYAVLCLPILFAAGMSLLDSIDGAFMNFAYGWSFSNPVRKVYYNLTITGLSIVVALFVGTVELGGLLAQELGAQGSFWAWVEGIDINRLGLVIVAAFVATWATAIAIWRFGRIEQRWSARYLGGSERA